MAGKNDPRVTSQERFLQAATFEWRAWSSDQSDSDHDHCAFCWVHFGDHVFSDDADTQLEGWATPDGDHWVCRTCFADFREAFEFQTVNNGPASPEALLDGLRGALEWVAWSSEVQLAWCKRGPIWVPVDEIPQSLEDAAFTLRPRIREAGLLPREADARIDELLDWFTSMRALDHPRLWEEIGLDQPEWEEARLMARRALAALDDSADGI